MLTEPLLEVENLKVAFRDHVVLSGLSFQISGGEVVSVIGRSGSGKTVLLRTLAGLLHPQTGHIKFHFKNKNAVPIGFAFQKSPLIPWLSVQENLNLCVHNETDRLHSQKLLKNVGLASFKNHSPQDISGGMAQKVNLLRALSNRSELILMDEPFGSLDGFQRTELQQFTHDTCRNFDRGLVLITHDIDEAILLSDRIFILNSKSGMFSHQIPVNIIKPKILVEMRSNTKYNQLYQQVLKSLNETETIN